MRPLTRISRPAAVMLSLAVALGALTGCGQSTQETGAQPTASGKPVPGSNVSLNGAGATFPYPIYSKWFSEFNKLTGAKVNYQSIGSGGGIKQITEKTVDFGASDAPLKDEQIKAAPGILHIPTVLGAVVIGYNLQGVSDLKLNPEVLSGIYLGEIKKWNDPKLAALNPGTQLPATDINVAYRSDGSGTTSVFTDYLSKISPAWKDKVGSGTSVKWPAGVGGKGSEGVAGLLKQTPGTIGYVEVAYAEQNKLPYAQLQNKAGNYVKPSLENISAAAAGAIKDMPADYRVSITNADGPNTYPIAAFTYLLVYADQADQAKGEAIANLLWWAIHDGQKLAPTLLYAPLPAELVSKVEATVKSIKHNGQPLLK